MQSDSALNMRCRLSGFFPRFAGVLDRLRSLRHPKSIANQQTHETVNGEAKDSRQDRVELPLSLNSFYGLRDSINKGTSLLRETSGSTSKNFCNSIRKNYHRSNRSGSQHNASGQSESFLQDYPGQNPPFIGFSNPL
jgi:hypothetical protein